MMLVAYRASIVHCVDEINEQRDDAYEYYSDGILLVEDGIVRSCGDAAELLPQLPAHCQLKTYINSLIVPGFVDAHIHFPQLDIIASSGEQLMDWLTQYVFPYEARYHDEAFCYQQAHFFLRQLLSHGTTTALVFSSSHEVAVTALFHQASEMNMRLISGLTLSDSNVPDSLHINAKDSYLKSKRLIDKWHGHRRLHYAVTPRFAITSSPAQLTAAGRLLQEVPDVYLQTHLAENRQEIQQVAKLFPDIAHYTAVYARYHLVTARSVFAHCIHLDGQQFQMLAQQGAAIAFCPTSNLFLGSGLFNLQAAQDHHIPVALGTDIGAGTSLSLLQTAGEAYKVCQLQDKQVSAMQLFYLMTLGGARALHLDNYIGNFLPGKEADFNIINLHATPLLARRLSLAVTIDDILFALMILGDDRVIAETYLCGQLY